MKSSEIRNMIREEIMAAMRESTTDMSFLDKVGGSIRSKLGTGRNLLDRALDMIDTEKLSRLPRQQKIELIAAMIGQLGVTAQDFNAVKSRVQRMLTMSNVSEPYTEGKLNEEETDTVNELEFGQKASLGSIAKAKQDLGGGLASKKEKMEKTQAYQMMVKALENKPANAQVDFVIDFLNSLPLDDAAKTKLKMKIKSELE